MCRILLILNSQLVTVVTSNSCIKGAIFSEGVNLIFTSQFAGVELSKITSLFPTENTSLATWTDTQEWSCVCKRTMERARPMGFNARTTFCL